MMLGLKGLKNVYQDKNCFTDLKKKMNRVQSSLYRVLKRLPKPFPDQNKMLGWRSLRPL